MTSSLLVLLLSQAEGPDNPHAGAVASVGLGMVNAR